MPPHRRARFLYHSSSRSHTHTHPPCPLDRRPSDGASLTLPSNNPFRNRAASPSSLLSEPSPQSPTFKSRPVSRNPFLDSVDAENHVVSPQSPRSPNKAMSNPTGGEAAPGSGLSNGTLDIFVSSLSIFGLLQYLRLLQVYFVFFGRLRRHHNQFANPLLSQKNLSVNDKQSPTGMPES